MNNINVVMAKSNYMPIIRFIGTQIRFIDTRIRFIDTRIRFIDTRIRFVGTRCIAFLQNESITIGQRKLFYYLCRSKI
jgi:hypothetical protein